MDIPTKRSLATLLLFSVLSQTSALNIVVLSTIPTMSHCTIGNAMTDLLLKRGHHVYELTVFPFKVPHPNRTSFVVEGGMAKFDLDPSSMSVISHVGIIMYQYSWSIETCKQVLDSPATRDLLAFARDPNRPQIDVVVHSYMFHECLGPFASEFQAPFVPLSAFPNSFHMDELVGGPIFPGFIPHDYVVHPHNEPMDWFKRLESKWAYLVSLMGSHFYKYPRMDALSKAFFGENSPTVDEVRQSAPVALVNSHPAIQGARPQLPAIVQIGGFHVPPAKELPAGKMKDFLDGAKDGFVLISFGSIMSLSKMEPWRREALMRAFKRLRPLRFIMKWEVPWNEAKDGSLPDNVFLAPWIPQSDVVGHPNIRLFVTQCGGLSTVEIISHSLPIIAVPFYSDQRINANKLVAMGAGIILPYTEIDEETFYSAVRKVLDDKKYVTAVRRLSSLYHDQPETPQERAAFWVEFVARHKDIRHLRSPGELTSWATRWMVDDIALAVGIVITLVYVFRRLRSRSKVRLTKTKTS